MFTEALDMSTFERVIKSLPSQTDLEAIVDGIFRLQEVYNIPAEEFVFGRMFSGSSDTITGKYEKILRGCCKN